MMGNVPFISTLCHKHGEAGRSGHRLALDHTGEHIKTSHNNCILIEHDGSGFAYIVLVSGAFQGRKVRPDGVLSLGYHGTNCSEKNSVRPIMLDQSFIVIGAVCRRPSLDYKICIF